ncbi:CoA-transferase [Alicycliphilus denitrificans]|uniref:CoA-transferase n=1 Tax=Alicycliphilus denitrificans TaxID=179636 RepID=UPI00384BFAFD
MSMHTLSREELARLVAHDLPDFSSVNLGIGMPTMVARYLMPQSGVQLHSENGILGMRDLQADEAEDSDLINASKEFIRLAPGASIFDHALSFGIMRGGHLDVTVLGAFEVSSNGDLANWSLGESDPLPSVGGAMDLAQGARSVWVMMETRTRDGQSRLRRQCTLPLTGHGVVSRVYTELGVFAVSSGAFRPLALVKGATEIAVRSSIDGALQWTDDYRVIASGESATPDGGQA